MKEIIFMIVLIIIVIALVTIHYAPSIETVINDNHKEIRLWYNEWSKCKDEDVVYREYIVLLERKIKD